MMRAVSTLIVTLAFTLVVLAAFGTGWLVRRRGHGPVGNGHSIAYVSMAFAFILGLVLSMAIGHYDDARNNAQAEAAKITAVLGAANPLPTAQRTLIQTDTLCVMHSIVDDEWPLMRAGDDEGSPTTNTAQDKLFNDISALSTTDPLVTRQYGSLFGNVLAHGEMRDQRLVDGIPRVPLHVWLLLAILAYVVVLFIALHEHIPSRRAWAAIGTLLGVTIIATIAVMSMLDHPYEPGLAISPYAMERSIAILHDVGSATGSQLTCPT